MTRHDLLCVASAKMVTSNLATPDRDRKEELMSNADNGAPLAETLARPGGSVADEMYGAGRLVGLVLAAPACHTSANEVRRDA